MKKLSVTFLLLLAAVGFAFSPFSKHKKKPEQYMQATINKVPVKYRYQVSGLYDAAKHMLYIKAYDTLSPDSKFLAINILLGESKLDTMHFPHVYTPETDSKKHQASYAQLIWDNHETELYDNFTYRSWTKLNITLTSYKKHVLSGTFSGILMNQHKKAGVRDGSFVVVVQEKKEKQKGKEK
jgi:hypothetical protein